METHSFRLIETTNITEITLHHRTDGQLLVPWGDIERAFPGVTLVPNGISVIKFLRGADYQSISQCSQSMDVVLSTSVESVPIKSDLGGGQTNVPIEVTLPISGNADPSPRPVSGFIASSEATSFKQIVTHASRKAREAEVEQRFISILTPEVQETVRASSNIYHSFAKIIKDGHRDQELSERVQNIEAIVVHNTKLQEEIYVHQKEMSAMVDEVKQLEKQVLSNQEEMKVMQQKTLNQIGVLYSRVQAILTQTYELHEYPIPRLFVVLPQDPSGWDALNPFSNKFRLYFLCECGEHTRSIKSAGPHKIHFAKHEGYEIARPSEFFEQYGQYILTILKMLKVGISVAGVAVPAVSNLVSPDTIGLATASLQLLIEPGMDQIIGWMDKISVNEGEAGDEFAEHMEKRKALEGADLRKLDTFLKDKDDQKVLGNLYRTVTDEGHVKWVCIDHYRMNYQESSAKEFQRVLDSVEGSFSENDGKVVVSLQSSVLADQFYSALGRARSVYELDIALDWDCTTSDVEALEVALKNSRVSILRLDLQRLRMSIASKLLPTLTQYEFIFRIRDLPQVKVFHIVISEENIKFPGLTPKTSTHASKISCELKFRPARTRKSDIMILAKALEINSTLTTLDLEINNIEGDGASALAEALKINSTLTTLNLEINNIGVDGAKALAEALKINSTLTTLDLDINNIGGDGAKALAVALKINSNLTTLSLYHNNIGDDGAKALAEALKINSNLTTLSLYHNNIGDDGAKALAEALKINSTLTTLYLEINNIRDDGAKALAEALKINSTLTTLDLRANNIGDDGAKALAEVLKINSTLTTLDLYDNSIGDDGAKALAEALKINSTLITLNLRANNIGFDGVKVLAEALKINSTLTTLDLKYNNIGIDGAKVLAEALKINLTLNTSRLAYNYIRKN